MNPPLKAARRLLVICHGFPPYYGGAEHVAYFLAREAARSRAWEVTVLTSDIGGRLPPDEQREGMRVIRLPAHKKEWTRHTLSELVSFMISGMQSLDRVLAEVRPDVVLAHFTLPAGRLAQWIHRKTGVPYFVVLHGSDVPGYQPKRFGWVYRLIRPITRSIWRNAHGVIAVSAELRDLALQTWPGGDLHVIQNGVDVSEFHPRDAAPRAKEGKLKAVVVAQLIERKGLQFLLQALAGLPAPLRSRLDVAIYGVGPYACVLESLALSLNVNEAVTFHGLAKHEQLPEIMREAELFILPSLQEGLPLSLLEAMSSGLAIVATRVGGIPAVLQDREQALLVDAADSAQLQTALAEVIQSKALRKQLGSSARQRALDFAWEEVWGRYEKICLAERPGIH